MGWKSVTVAEAKELVVVGANVVYADIRIVPRPYDIPIDSGHYHWLKLQHSVFSDSQARDLVFAVEVDG